MRMNYNCSEIEKLNNKFKNSLPGEILSFFADKHKGRIAFASSLGAEDQVLTQLIASTGCKVKIFTLDTGRLFQESYDLIQRTNLKYNISIGICFPDYNEVEEMVNENGINLFYDSVENRKKCCFVRKAQPLKRILKGVDVWICGLRNEQSETRKNNNTVEWDESNGLLRVNPLIAWTEKQLWDYIKKNSIPYNPLHDRGYPSIGCQPCTRSVESGDDIRAGRWWWENMSNKECGIIKNIT